MNELHVGEDEQVEALKKWWKENGTAIIVGVIAAVAIVVGVFQWRAYQENKIDQASFLYSQFAKSKTPSEAAEILNSLKSDYSGTSYAAFAAIAQAGTYANQGKLEQAEKELRWALQNPGHETQEHIARVALARVLLQSGRKEEALELVKVNASPSFTAQYSEVLGDIQVSLGNLDAARQAYKTALEQDVITARQRDYISMKLADIAVADETP